jgi:glycosyltransferase involved in cell wall biosynthesis
METKPKVLVLGHLPPSAGGITSLLLSIFSSEIAQNFELVPFNIGRPAKRRVTHNYGYHAIFNSGFRRALLAIGITLWHIVSFPVKVLVHRPGIIHIHTAPYLVFWETTVYVLVARLFRIPCILHFHSSLRHFLETSGSRVRAGILWVIRRSSVFAVICKEDLQLFRKGRGTTQWVYLPNFMAIDTFRHSVDVVREPVQPHREISLLFLGGSDAAHKGFLDLLHAVRSLKMSQLGLRLLLVAVPRDKVVSELPEYLLPFCDVQEWVSGKAKLDVFARSDILVLPSYAEGMPMSILEAMACSMPVIASRVGGIPDMITDGWDGYLVAPGNAKDLSESIYRLVQDPTKIKEMGKRAYAKALTHYNISVGIGRLESLYGEILRQVPSFQGNNPTLRQG